MGNVEVQWAMWKFPYIRDHIDQSATISYTSTHFISMGETQRRFQAKIDGRAKCSFTRTFVSGASWVPYVHFHEETRIYMNKEALGGYQFLRYFLSQFLFYWALNEGGIDAHLWNDRAGTEAIDSAHTSDLYSAQAELKRVRNC